MHKDFKELLSALNDEKVKYLVVGGYAVSVHAQPRATKDLDILVQPDEANAAALFRALAKFGAPLEGLKPDDFTERGSFFRMGTPPVMVDILPEIAGVEFDRAWRRRVMETIDAETGLKAPFISVADLIAAKEAAGRAQDLADAEALRTASNRAAISAQPKGRRPAKKPAPKAPR
jgi:uncharacterized nucleotidyltransferase DUF6036